MKKSSHVRTVTQHQKFIDAAKAAECDDDPKRFADRVKKVSTAPPPHQPMKTRKK